MAAAIFCGAVRNARAETIAAFVAKSPCVRSAGRSTEKAGISACTSVPAATAFSRALRTAVLTCSLAILTAFDIGMFLSV